MKQRAQRRVWRRGPRVWAVAAAAVIMLAAGVSWWASARRTAEGPPRLAVDRETIDLGELRFSAPASATFTLTNTGTGSLRIVDAPRVKVVQGC